MRRGVLAAGIGVFALSGCSLGADEETAPRPARGAPREIGATVRALERATRMGEWRRVCEKLFTAAARRRAGGKDCPRLLRSAAGQVRRPRIELLRIELDRRGAEIRVRTRALGQPALEDTMRLVRERGRYRIDSLGA
jgi:hypothetical protein